MPTPEREARALQAADAALREGRWPDAATLYQKLLAIAPAHAEGLHGYGLVLLRLGQSAFGVVMLQRALAAQPGNAMYLHSLGRALAGVDTARAADLLTQACALAPDNAEFANTLAQCLQSQGRGQEAIAPLELACGACAGSAASQAAWTRLVELCFEQDELERAMRHRQAMLAHWPALAALYRLGYASAETGEPDVMAPRGLPADMNSDATGLPALAQSANLRVVDDVLPDPMAYRAQALLLPFRELQHAGQNFPGSQTDGQDCDALMAQIARLLGKTVKWSSPDNGAFRLSLAASQARADIHVDQPVGLSLRHHAGVLYLNLPEQCRGGTSFWRHRPTGWDRRPTLEQLREQGYTSAAQFQRRWLKSDQCVPFEALKAGRLDWEQVAEVPMRFNRLVVYRSDFFHSISEVFGHSSGDGRLVQLFFFETVD